MTTGDDVDRLYQAPLGEFTAKRNEMVTLAPASRREAIRALQKPVLPAWAVNQLYWKRRRVFDRLIEAARKLRVEHGRQLAGKGAEVDAAEARHRDAIKAASDEIRALLKAAGEQDTPATMIAVAETLQGLPGRDDHGRLTKPLKPQGFEALAGLMSKSGATIARLTTATAASSGSSGASGSRKRELQARAKEVASAERALRRAEVEERAARAEMSRAEMTLARLQRERKELQERVDAITSRRDQAAIDLDERRRAADRARGERERLEEGLKVLKK